MPPHARGHQRPPQPAHQRPPQPAYRPPHTVQNPPVPADERPPLLADQRPPVHARGKLASAMVTAFSLALAPAAAGLALLLFPAVDDGRPPEKPLIQVIPRPAVAGTATATPLAPLTDVAEAPGK